MKSHLHRCIRTEQAPLSDNTIVTRSHNPFL
uniref:Uncharacterized protein n=1 Tax=Anguilla anguilla TaxID=7936 RepID=A0A0E9XCV6_ANGAN